MWKMQCNKICLLLSFLVPQLCYATPRIEARIVDLGEIHQIKMVVGMLTTILIPGNVTGVRLGNPSAMTFKVPESPKNEVSLWLNAKLPRPTNLQIVSGNKRYVFDVIPTISEHQDIVKVVGTYGGPSVRDPGVEVIATSHRQGGAK
jgi:hypothetical protein